MATKKPMTPSPTPPVTDGDDPTPAYTGPAYPDYNALASKAQSPNQTEGAARIFMLASCTQNVGVAFTSIRGGIAVPTGPQFVDPNGTVTPSVSVPVIGHTIFINQCTAANRVTHAVFRLKKNNLAITDWISLIQLISHVTTFPKPGAFGKPISPFAGPDASFQAFADTIFAALDTTQKSVPHHALCFKVGQNGFDTVEFSGGVEPLGFSVNAIIAAGSAEIVTV